jgi:DNA ligase D-like protein (predicted ligase)
VKSRSANEKSAGEVPSFVGPMLARLAPKLPTGKEWIYEVKWDGYRVEAAKSGREVRLYSRRGSDFTRKFSAVSAAVTTIKAERALLDGEVVAVDRQGHPSFQALQNRGAFSSDWSLRYYVFDILHLNGRDLRERPLVERKELLEKVIAGSDVFLSPGMPGTLSQITKAIKKAGLEGVVAKRRDSVYESGQRSGAWTKLPLKPRQEFVVGGYRPDGNSLELLLVGYFEDGRFLFAGKVRQGLNPAKRLALVRELKAYASRKCYFENLPSSRTGHWGEGVTAEEMGDYVWLKPSVVAEVKFTEWTTGGVLRHAEFFELREDKPALEVVRE